MLNYNSRSFTIIAVCLMIGIMYWNDRSSNNSKVGTATVSPQNAQYILELDPNKGNGEQTLYDKAILFLFKDKISQRTEQHTHDHNAASRSMNTGYKVNVGDKVSVVYYTLDPLPTVLPSPVTVVIGGNTLPKEIDESVVGMHVGEHKEIGNYRIKLVGVIETEQ